jgi:hypothetical protein
MDPGNVVIMSLHGCVANPNLKICTELRVKEMFPYCIEGR